MASLIMDTIHTIWAVNRTAALVAGEPNKTIHERRRLAHDMESAVVHNTRRQIMNVVSSLRPEHFLPPS